VVCWALELARVACWALGRLERRPVGLGLARGLELEPAWAQAWGLDWAQGLDPALALGRVARALPLRKSM